MPEAKTILEQLILRCLWQILQNGDPDNLETDIERLKEIIDVGEQLHLGLSLDRAQEVYYNCLQNQIAPTCFLANSNKDNNKGNNCRWQQSQLCLLLHLGEKLAIDITPWLN